jgi:hypothetical protein
MAASPKNSSRATVVTEAMAKPTNEREAKEAMVQVVNALRGTYGTGEWDGGFDGASGYWTKYSMFWDAKLSFDGGGSATITFPFTVVDSIVKVYMVSGVTVTQENHYIVKGNNLTLAGLTGKTIIELAFVKNTKETI